MAQSAYLYNDLVKSLAGASIAITNEDPAFPTENLQSEQIALVCRTSAKVAIKLQFTLAAGAALKAFYVGNHNFTGGTFDINSYTNVDFVTGKVQVEVNKAIRLLDIYHYESSTPDSRTYWEFDFTNATSADTYFSIGRVMLYTDWVTLTSIEDYERGRSYGFRNIINETDYGIRWVHKMTDKRERFGLVWKARKQATSALPAELRTLYNTVYGDAYPFLFVPDITLTDCHYVYVEDNELRWTDVFGSDTVFNINLNLIEAVRGKL